MTMTVRTDSVTDGTPGTARDDHEPDLEPKLLRAFLTLAQERHFGHAADLLGLAQPVLSRQIQQLERHLGTALFERTPQGAVLTAVGRAIQPEVERLLQQQREIRQTVRRLLARAPRELTVAAPLPGPTQGLLPAAISRARASFPGDLRITIVDLEDEAQVPALTAGRVDVVLTWGEPERPGLESVALTDEPALVVLSAGHPRVGASILSLSDLVGEPLLFPVRERRHCWHRITDQVGELAVVPTAPGAVIDLVAAGLGVSVVPASFQVGAPEKVWFVPLPDLDYRMTMLWRAAEADDAVLGFVRAAQQAAAELISYHPEIYRASDQGRMR